MHSKYPHLFSPIKVAHLTFKNRIEYAPIAMPNYKPGGFATLENMMYYDQKARSGAGLVVHDETTVHKTSGGPEGAAFDKPARLMIDMKRESDTVHRYGGISSLSLCNYGGWVNVEYAVDGKIYGPSAIENPYGVMTTELPEALLEEIAEEYGRAAYMAMLSGHDMCQIHGAHGWLLNQFLSPAQNKRTDKFGGSLENRARFPLMVVEAIRRWAPRLPIEYRFSANEHIQDGFTPDEAVGFARLLGDKVDLLHLSSSTFWDPSCGNLFPGMFVPHSLNVEYAAMVKKATDVPVAVVGAHSDLAYMDEVIASGQADILAVARGFLADPFWAKKAYDGDEADITPCVRCNYCVPGAYEPAHYSMFHVHMLRCTVNPSIGKEHYPVTLPAATPKKLVIIGGGPGGIQAAITASDRGHQVILCEAEDRLGGLLNEIIGPSFKEDYRRYRAVLLRRVEQRPIEVRLNTRVTPALLEELQPDAIFAAVGSKPVLPDIPGIDGPQVLTIDRLRRTETGRRVAIIGGGSAGAEEALACAEAGKEVTVVELRDSLGLGAPYLHYQSLQKEFEKPGAPRVFLRSTCTKITPEGIAIRQEDGAERFVEADSVLVAVGMRPRTEEAEQFRPYAKEFRLIGDCRQVATICEAVADGFECAYGL